jgi:ParB/RepB/Spo0J family partition protein
MSSPVGPISQPVSLWEEATSTHEFVSGHPVTIQDRSDDHRPLREASNRTRVRLPVSRIDPDPRNPRVPTPQEVTALAEALTSHGLLQPIVVRPVGQRYTVVAGHRRLAGWCRCASDAPTDPRWRVIDAVVRDVGAEEALTLMLVENLQRKSLSPLQEAVTLQRLRTERSWSNRQVAQAIQKSEMYVSRRLRVLEDDVLRDAVLNGGLAVTTAEELLAADSTRRGPLVEKALAEGWSPTEARRAVQAAGRHVQKAPSEDPWRAQLLALEHLLRTQPAPPDALRGEIMRVAHRLLDQSDA